MDYDKDFIHIINFLKISDFQEKYDTEKLYKIYKIIKNTNNQNLDNITLYNNILNSLVNNKNSLLTSKDNIFLKKIFKIINIVNNINFEFNDMFDIEIHLNYHFYKNIDDETYKIINLYKEQLKKEDPIILYKELWHKFLSPFANKIIDIDLDYYIDYMNESIVKVKIVNSNIINKYFDKLITNKIKKLKYLEIPNKEILFFILLLDKF